MATQMEGPEKQQVPYPLQHEVRKAAVEAAEEVEMNLTDLPLAVTKIIETVGELEHGAFEESAYTVTLEQYAEVAADLVRTIIYMGN